MKITGLTVVPDFGYFGDQLIKGNQQHRYFQSDVVNGYMLPFMEELENNYVLAEMINTHKKPAMSLEARQEIINKNRPTIFLGCDWMKGNATHNTSRVYYSDIGCQKFAAVLCESLEEWGQRYVYGHRVAKPKLDAKISKGQAVRISPFALNGPGADQYLLRLRELGEALGLSVMLWLNERRTGRIRYG